MSRVCLSLARFALSAWVGAAALFVVNGVREVTSTDFDSMTRDRLVTLRFPAYYEFGFALVGVALVCLVLTLGARLMPRKRQITAVVLAGLALAVMTYDFKTVYQPLEKMITPPGQARPMEFTRLHERSKTINSLHVGLSLVAAILICWPASVEQQVAAAVDES